MLLNEIVDDMVAMLARLSAERGVSTQRPAELTMPDPIPQRLKSPGGAMFANPAILDDPYYGRPENYSDLTTTQKTLLQRINVALQRNRLAPITELWGGKYNGRNINFAAYGANRQVLWRKYDVGGGSGQNWFFVGDTKMKTSDFVRHAPEQQDILLSRLTSS